MEKSAGAPAEPKLAKKKSTKEKSTSRSSSNEGNTQARDKEKREKAENNQNSVQGRWSKIEHERFIEAIKKFGKDWKSVESFIESRSGSQIRSHAQKFFNRLIKKFEIDKTEVISYIQNEYEAAGSSGSTTPKKKLKTDNKAVELQDPKLAAPVQSVLLKDKEAPAAASTHKLESVRQKRGEASHTNKENREMTHSMSDANSIKSNGDNREERHKTISWKAQMETIIEIASKFAKDLEQDKEKISRTQQINYAKFLASFQTKCLSFKSLDISYGFNYKPQLDEPFFRDSSALAMDFYEHNPSTAHAFITNRKKSFQLNDDFMHMGFQTSDHNSEGEHLRKRKTSYDGH